jgi:Uma2 family endonuclease
VPEYWVVNVRDQVVEIFTRPGASGYRVHRVVRRSATLEPTLLAHVRVPVADILPPAKRRAR